jgi:hypothetical protein
MTSVPTYCGLIVRARSGSAGELGAAASKRLGVALEPLLPVGAAVRPALGLAPAPSEWLLARSAPRERDNPWDEAHDAVGRLGLEGAVTYAEPDLLQQFPVAPPHVEGLAGAAERRGGYDDQDADFPRGPGFAWFLDDAYSGLRAARSQAAAAPTILHVDTGYDPEHRSVPKGLLESFARDFEGDKEVRGARDPRVKGPLRNPGHGTGTLSILAGARVRSPDATFDEALGGAPGARVIPVRIANSVVLFRTSALARALDYALGPYDGPNRGDRGEVLPPVDVVTLSMGGVASGAWAEAVNAAYEAGVCVVAAAGNNFSTGSFGVPTRFIVYPARFRRVIAACGAMADRRPYYGLAIGKLQGCFGPFSKMATAVAAFTPNMPWAEMGAPEIVDMNGQGTSSATPQVAAAAALWIAHNRQALDRYAERWQRVEAVRHALFTSADRAPDGSIDEKLGNGLLRAGAALALGPPAQVAKTPRDRASLPLLRVLTGLGLAAGEGRGAMLALEATQLAQLPTEPGARASIEEVLRDPDAPPERIGDEDLVRAVEVLRDHPRASRPLRDALERARRELGARPVVPVPRAPEAPKAPPGGEQGERGVADVARSAVAAPPFRRLVGFAFDPSVAQRLDTRDVSLVTFKVPWERLEPGPIGEYLEVIDHDPVSGCSYAPIDLDDPHLLAQDGHPPSEGTPQFHQQMAYAVASLTIRHFEEALGRRALWAPGPPPAGASERDDSTYVARLRVYPHALREANAYYSPAKKALLLGYFRASDDDPGEHLPGGYVFTCLSHDIVAHETAHALLDGMHRKFTTPTNPDVRAFHEAFADVVALFLHFTHPEIVRDQIRRTRGGLRSREHLLGVLATEFGRASGTRGALRDYIGLRDPATGVWRPHVPSPREYQETGEPHARGAVLVSAVFDGFLAIYERRTRDLIRLATGGSGVLPDGDVHPDLVARLAREAAESAEQVLRMCIRALDYCPPVDLTFGEYLRALLTADRDLVPYDDLGYRVAFIEAFRRRAIYPRDVRALSEESLAWRGPDRAPSPALLGVLTKAAARARDHLDERDRHRLFDAARELRQTLHGALCDVLTKGDRGREDAALLGLELGEGDRFEVHAARFADRVGPDGQHAVEMVIELLQRKLKPVDPAVAGGEQVPFEGGATVVVRLGADQRPGERSGDAQEKKGERRQEVTLRYVIRKSVGSRTRLERQLAYAAAAAASSPFGTYFGEQTAYADAEPFSLLHRS